MTLEKVIIINHVTVVVHIGLSRWSEQPISRYNISFTALYWVYFHVQCHKHHQFQHRRACHVITRALSLCFAFRQPMSAMNQKSNNILITLYIKIIIIMTVPWMLVVSQCLQGKCVTMSTWHHLLAFMNDQIMIAWFQVEFRRINQPV